MPRPRVLFIPSRSDVGPYVSLVRLERTTREALEPAFERVELAAHPSDGAAFLAAFRAAAPFDAVLDLSDQLAHAAEAPDTPTLLYALGNMPTGATLLWMRRPRLKSSDVLLLNCRSDETIFHNVLGHSGPRAALLPLGVDTARFRPRGPGEDAATRRALGLEPGDFVLVYSGRLNVQKNLHSVLYLLRELKPREPRVKLVLAGSFDSIPHLLFDASNEGYEARLRGLLDRWGLEDSVRFAGGLGDEDLARLLSAADAYVSLTLHGNENFGYAPVEAMAAGRPAVVSHWGGLKDTVVHGETGFHVETVMTDNGPRAAWRQAVEPLLGLARDPAAARRLGAAARARAEREYSLEAFAARLRDHVVAAVQAARAGPARRGAEFRFHREAMALFLRNLYRTASRAEGRPPAGERRHKIDYPTYRWFQAPYATRDVADLRPASGDRLAFLTRVQLDRAGRRLDSDDPIWPESFALDEPELGMLASLEPGTTLDEALARGRKAGLDPARAAGLLERLLARGILYLDRPFTP